MRKHRDKYVRETYFKVFDSFMCNHTKMSTEAIISAMMDAQAPRFFVSFQTAQRVVSQMVRGITPRSANKNKLLMYEELFRRYIEQGGDGTSYKILEKILRQPAPSLYINRSTMRTIVYRSMKKSY